ncbi:MAG: FtsQ-type POTRA domain-containing protein [Actinomyces sp.]|nr:FtsQ-type POTRA domain-containing protein [Actinomyces sp.]
MEETVSSFDEILSPSAGEEAQESKRHSSSLTQRRRARTTVDRPMPVADAASLLGGEEATDLGDRLRERTRARRILLARRIVLTLVTLALAAGGVWVAFFSSVFAFSSSSVVVSGEDGTLVTADSVRSSIASFEGVPLTRLDTQAVARAVESNVAVRSASVSRRWPTSLRVSVTMRTGMAVEAASGGYWLVDDQGVAFQQVPSVGEYPLATLPEDRATGAADIASVLGALDEATRAQVAAVTSTGTQVNFTLRGGQTVKWGTRGDAPQKARVLATLLANVQASTYDVSSPNHPVTS